MIPNCSSTSTVNPAQRPVDSRQSEHQKREVQSTDTNKYNTDNEVGYEILDKPKSFKNSYGHINT